MSISTVTTDDLRRMNGKEGLVLQGCGGDPQEWLDGINSLLTDELAVGLFPFRRGFVNKPAEAVRHIN